jgi:hypothetical protein
LKITISENLGEVKVTDYAFKPLSKAYVKCFAMMNDGSITFYKDGYTDLRGRFNYVSLNTDQIKTLKKFAVFISDKNNGSVIQECNPPGNVLKGQISYDQIESHRSEMKKIWRENNFKK